ncbi:MAG: phosphoenolpyruvate carboxykinase [Deltaproteobacteria bacterium]|nr:phosphoenolpyruvate carboxykinase [Deltaproteobacteria bacterium]
MKITPPEKTDFYLSNLSYHGKQVVLYSGGILCSTTHELVHSWAFATVFKLFVDHLFENQDSVLNGMTSDLGTEEGRQRMLSLLWTVAETPIENAVRVIPGADHYQSNPRALYLFVEAFYDFWRSHDRYLVCYSEQGPRSHDRRPYRTFNVTIERLTDLIRSLYRDMCENITGDHSRIYRQVAAGCNLGVIATRKEWNPPSPGTLALADIPFIRQVLINPPLIIDPPENRRTGQFLKVDRDPLEGLELESDEWLCYPAQVGPLSIFIYFHQVFMGLGCSLANLFELASDDMIASGPDAVFLYGVPAGHLSEYGDVPTVFYDDEVNGIITGAIPGEDRFGYFGYLKKMALTLHNIKMMKRGRMPFHGAMARIMLRNGKESTVLVMGETATGKSETLEALRVIGREFIRNISIISDDMGSLGIDDEGRVLGYGTETGAFIRLDDLQRGYALKQVNRAIIMSPQKANARVLIPVNFIEEILKGYPIGYILYANNYEQVDEDHPVIQTFPTAEIAMTVFREGAAMSKGTTTSTGLTHSYFANIFGPPQYREVHEELAVRTFDAAFTSGIFVGQMRTRLAVPGFETEGPRLVAKALLELITEKEDGKKVKV